MGLCMCVYVLAALKRMEKHPIFKLLQINQANATEGKWSFICFAQTPLMKQDPHNALSQSKDNMEHFSHTFSKPKTVKCLSAYT